jgi:DEAD/DEAH box helicase domain-containing protein
MNLTQLLHRLKTSPEFVGNVTHWEFLAPKKAELREFPDYFDPRLKGALKKKSIFSLYSHQHTAMELLHRGKHIVVETPTASGKTLCYNLPVLQSYLEDPDTRALYLFPTKALSQDQVAELYELVEIIDIPLCTYTYDGDTPPVTRRAIRNAGHIVVTNPDMLHTGILPHHTQWVRLFENLKYVVIDEIHHYRGVFGSHLANVLRRLQRITRFYGSNPLFICCSATIANPKELAEWITGKPVELVDNNGAPHEGKHFIFYNPPVVNRQLGIRRSLTSETQKIAAHFVKNDIQTIVFARSRLRVEILATYLREAMATQKKPASLIRGYRGGYLPRERREIEKGLRHKSIIGVVATNALELGIDIGQLEVSVVSGYPGSISSTWQQAGRAGRRSNISAAILIASSAPLDQYLISHPEYFFQQSPEVGIIDPQNLVILTSHLKCSVFELPFSEGEDFGTDAAEAILDYLAREKLVHKAGGKWYWASEAYPAESISLRSASPENFVILDSRDRTRVIGEVDYHSAPMMIYRDAIYLHQDRQYQIEELDWEGKKAYAKEVKVDYYTDAETSTDIRVLDVFEEEPFSRGKRSHGEVSVTTVTLMYKKVKFHTHENVGRGEIHLPQQEIHTTSFWLEFDTDFLESIETQGGKSSDGLKALAHVLSNVVPLFIMSDPKDIRVVPMIRSPFHEHSTIYVYDNYPGGVGFSEKVFHMAEDLLKMALQLLKKCPCTSGCPSCSGATLETGSRGKSTAILLAGEFLSRLES